MSEHDLVVAVEDENRSVTVEDLERLMPLLREYGSMRLALPLLSRQAAERAIAQLRLGPPPAGAHPSAQRALTPFSSELLSQAIDDRIGEALAGLEQGLARTAESARRDAAGLETRVALVETLSVLQQLLDRLAGLGAVIPSEAAP